MRLISPVEETGSASNTIPNFLLRLMPLIQIFNHLPYTLVLHHQPLPLPLTLDPGGSTSITKLDPLSDEELDVQASSFV